MAVVNRNALRRAEQGFTYAGETDLTVMGCPDCGITYAIPEVLRNAAHEAGHRKIVWHCPNGHELGYNGKSQEEQRAEKAEREAKIAKDRAARLAAERDQARASERAQRGQATKARNERDRVKRRVAHGVCPCCNRTFKDLQRHMKSKHPEVADETQPPEVTRS